MIGVFSLANLATARTIYAQTGEECGNIFENPLDILTPWPDSCQIYQTSNPCNFYEMSIDGEEVLSCDIAEMCIAQVQEPQCLIYYDELTFKGMVAPRSKAANKISKEISEAILALSFTM